MNFDDEYSKLELLLVMYGVVSSGTVYAMSDYDEKHSINLSASINNFSYDLFEIIARDDESDGSDLIFSPLSTHALLSMVALGSAEKSYNEMRRALHLKDKIIPVMSAYSILTHKLRNLENVTMNMSNSVWLSHKHNLEMMFEVQAQFFDIPIGRFNSRKPHEAAAAINEWIDHSTNHLIPDMMANYFMNFHSGMTLTSAGYFGGDWKYPFNKYLTEDRDFHLNEEEIRKVPMMFLEKTLKYGELPEQKARFVKLEYKNENVEMLIILPNEINGLEKVLANLRQFDEKAIEKAAKNVYVHLYLPKFKVASDTFILDGYLQELGMKAMFERSSNSFPDISDGTGLNVDSVLQKPFIKINEAGTTTKTEPVGWVVPSSKELADVPKVTFDVNRPFYYQISYDGTIMFQGATFFGARTPMRPKNVFYAKPWFLY